MTDNKHAEAVDLTKDPLALAMMAAWVGNVTVDQLPKEMRAHTCQHTMAAWKRVGDAALAHFAALNTRPAEAMREACARVFERAIGEGYPAPVNKVDQCEHGKFGWEDCIACYDEALIAAVEEVRSIPVPTSGEGGADHG